MKKNEIKPENVSDEVWRDFLIVRKSKNAVLTETAMKGIIREAGKAEISIENALIMCIENNWQGFRASWIKKNELIEKNQYGEGGKF